MRKIISKEEEAKKKRGKQLIVGIVLIAVMIFSTLGFAFQGGDTETTTDNSNTINFNGVSFNFAQDYNLWVTNIGGLNFIFSYNPNQIERIPGFVNNINSYTGKPLYIYSNNLSEAEQEIYRNLNPSINPLVQRMQNACPENKICPDSSLPRKTCQDNFIILETSDENSIIQEENCVFIKGKEEDLVKVTDEFLYKLLGIT